jgi:MFS family permease
LRPSEAAAAGPLAAPGFVRLWVAGAIGNTMLWLELLAAGLFTLQATGSALDVALVAACRALPLLGGGAFVGVLAEALDRKRIVLGGLLLIGTSSGSVAVLGLLGVARPWHLALAALVGGFVYATEYPARRRMIAECAGPAGMGRAIALDSLTGFLSRAAGPLLGGVAYGRLGLGGTFAVSSLLSLLAAALVAPTPHRQDRRTLAVWQVRRDLLEGIAFARRSRRMLALLGITVVMNLFGYAYTALMAPIGRDAYALSPSGVGVLAAAEPAGAFASGLLMTAIVLPGPLLGWFAAGAAVLLTALAAASLLPPLWPVCLMLLAGGLGSGVYTNCQTAMAMTAPPALRSRVMGLLTVCIGGWPIGQILVGLLTTRLSPLAALAALGLSGLLALAGVLVACRRQTASA